MRVWVLSERICKHTQAMCKSRVSIDINKCIDLYLYVHNYVYGWANRYFILEVRRNWIS